MAKLTLIANPGSASRKYGLYSDLECLARLHFEHESSNIICTLWMPEQSNRVFTSIKDLAEATGAVEPILREAKVLNEDDVIERLSIRVVAPSSFFLADRLIDDYYMSQLERAAERAPLHVGAELEEIRKLRQAFPGVKLIGVSDSKFHVTKPDYAWNYGLPLEDADRLDIKRFGYHGLSVSAAVDNLKQNQALVEKVVVCHLGSGCSVSAVYKGQSIDTTMGYSPLEGLVMASRSGSIDPVAVRELSRSLSMSHDETISYLNSRSGLLGVSGSSGDIRELLEREPSDYRARLALAVFVYGVQKAIGQMIAALGGIDALVFTGTVGERSAIIRRRVAANLGYLDIHLNPHTNDDCLDPTEFTWISDARISKPVYVIPTDESSEIVRAALAVV